VPVQPAVAGEPDGTVRLGVTICSTRRRKGPRAREARARHSHVARRRAAAGVRPGVALRSRRPPGRAVRGRSMPELRVGDEGAGRPRRAEDLGAGVASERSPTAWKEGLGVTRRALMGRPGTEELDAHQAVRCAAPTMPAGRSSTVRTSPRTPHIPRVLVVPPGRAPPEQPQSRDPRPEDEGRSEDDADEHVAGEGLRCPHGGCPTRRAQHENAEARSPSRLVAHIAEAPATWRHAGTASNRPRTEARRGRPSAHPESARWARRRSTPCPSSPSACRAR
jgi:hypothetical protein